MLKGLNQFVNRVWKVVKWHKYANVFFSQVGEDGYLATLFLNQNEGIYVDVGAHHPARYSNTLNLYLRGWHGINIDAMPGSMGEFDKHRKRDVNLEIGIGEVEGSMQFYIFEDPAYNTFSRELAEQRITEGCKLRTKKDVPIKRLDEVFERYLKNQEIDFMTIDTEGVELSVLKSNDWERWKPKYILCEILVMDGISSLEESEVTKYLVSKGYEIVSVIMCTVVFKLRCV